MKQMGWCSLLPRCPRPALWAGLLVFTWIWTGSALAQPADVVYVEEATAGLQLPMASLAGEHDGLSTVQNPGGLGLLGGFHANLGVGLGDPEQPATRSSGVGLYLASIVGGGLLPAVGLGLGLEVLRPSREVLDPDPGTPTRLSLAAALPLGSGLSLGVARHRFYDGGGLPLAGIATWDAGFSARFGAHWAMGGVIRDIGEPVVAGAPVERRYELEMLSRPLGTDRLELALGGRIGESRGDVDGWLRASVRLVRGLYLKGEVGSRQLTLLDTSGPVAAASSERELFAGAGVEISFGGIGAGVYGTGTRAGSRGNRPGSGALLVRVMEQEVPSIQGPAERIERIEITGDMDDRALTATLLRLRAIARDAEVMAVVVLLDSVTMGWAGAQELRAELLRVRQAGKKVFAFLVSGTTRDYFLASVADKVYLDPAGGLRLVGFAGTSMYFKGLFDKLGVAAQFEKIEEYKSAPESWTRDSPTEPAMRMRNDLYDSLYNDVIAAIAASRGLTPAKVATVFNGGPYTAGDLAEHKTLVDAVATPDQVGELISKELGRLYPIASAPAPRPARWSVPAIAVIYIDGDIVDGTSRSIPLIGRTLVGGETITQAIAAARATPAIKAIVLRIDSAGGSALASELMSREVFKTRKVKPIICSMGNVAASGGYYAAAGCDTIFADSMTITGSIGIFYGKFDISGLLAHLGISWVTYKRGEHADMDSYYRPYTEEERTIVKDKMRYLYNRFIAAVAAGRTLTAAQVDAVGRGRIWSGSEAQKHKLVDELGGVVDAIEHAKRRAGLAPDERVRIIALPQVKSSVLGSLLGLSGVKDGPELLDLLPGIGTLLEAIPASLLAQPDAPQARLPFSIMWE